MSAEVNYWKFATLGILLVGASVGATLLIMERDSKPDENPLATQIEETSGPAVAPVPPAPQAEHKVAAPAPTKSEPVSSERARSALGTQAKRNTLEVPLPPPPVAPQAVYTPQPVASHYPPQSVMNACNRYATEQVDSRAEEVLKNAALGAAIGAAVGAAGGAIAGGGKGAGKGAAIGGITGVTGGTLYGLNETKSQDAQYQEAYAACMRSKGY